MHKVILHPHEKVVALYHLLPNYYGYLQIKAMTVLLEYYWVHLYHDY